MPRHGDEDADDANRAVEQVDQPDAHAGAASDAIDDGGHGSAGEDIVEGEHDGLEKHVEDDGNALGGVADVGAREEAL
eukprot:6201616-Prymnesium_polylepis.1